MISKRLLSLTTISLYFSLIVSTQTHYTNLVFEGAGIRGIAYSGVIEQLEDRGIMSTIERVGGTSAGAITALLVAIGYTADEAYDLIGSTKFQKFNDGKLFFLGGLHRMNRRFGWYRSGKFERWLEAAIAAKTGDADITFAELRDQGYKKLYVTALCVNRQQTLVFSAETYPDMKVKDAVRISMSVPLYFEANFIDGEGRVYRNPDDRPDLDVVIDGGLLANFPIDLFDEIIVADDGTSRRSPNPKTLGIRIDSDAQIAGDRQAAGLVAVEVRDFKTYVAALYLVTIESLNRSQLTPEDWERTISVSSVGIGPKIRRLREEEQLRLMSSGRDAVNYFWSNY